MEFYLVGGAVRDKLLDIPVKDRDWVVVGAKPEDLQSKGFAQVGKDFPVFLHPTSKEEYALARTERKTGKGYTGFSTDFSSKVTLEEDLIRRDLTINAMAQTESGDIVDPYNGQKDLQHKILRHVSDAFVEDPLRVLRVARFAARFAHLGFTVAPETLALMQTISASEEIKTLSAERVWQETERALSEHSPEVYFEILKQTNALSFWFKELDVLWGVPNPAQHHPEIDTGVHTLMVLKQAAQLSNDTSVRFAALTHDLGKGITPKEKWPSHHGHEKSGLPLVKALCDRLRVNNACRDLAMMTCEHHGNVHRATSLKPSTVVSLFDKTDAFRKPERFENMLIACLADARGRTGFENRDYPQAEYLREAFRRAKDVDVQQIIVLGFKGKDIKQQLFIERCKVVEDTKTALLTN